MSTKSGKTRQEQEHQNAARRLKDGKTEILRRWEQHARTEVPAACSLDRETLHNNLPQVLDEIAEVLVTSAGKNAYDYAQISSAREHAEQRGRINEYSLDQVIMEYHLLRKVVIEVMEQEEPLPQGIASVIHDGLDRAMQDASVHFIDTHQRASQEHQERQRILHDQAEALREADRAKDNYLAILAHELRTPLGTISTALHILGQLELRDDRAFRQIATISRQVDGLSHLVNDLLDISRIVRGKLELQLELVELCRIATNAVQAVHPYIESRGHLLEVSLPAEPVWVEVDALRMEQVITNLLTNAAKYTEPGGTIWLTVTRLDDSATICVRDTGVGIPQDKLWQVFDLFNQLGLTSTHSQGGLGIGLSLARHLVNLHGGAIEATSEGPGMGSEFIVRLPVQTPTEPLPFPGPST